MASANDDVYGYSGSIKTAGRESKCRTCTDFQTWVSQNKIHSTSKKMSGCPLDKDELGCNTWSFLHTMAAYFPDQPLSSQQQDMKSFIYLFSKFYPCQYCAEDLRENYIERPEHI